MPTYFPIKWCFPTPYHVLQKSVPNQKQSPTKWPCSGGFVLGGSPKMPMIRSNIFFVGSSDFQQKHEKLVCQHLLFCRELLSFWIPSRLSLWHVVRRHVVRRPGPGLVSLDLFQSFAKFRDGHLIIIYNIYISIPLQKWVYKTEVLQQWRFQPQSTKPGLLSFLGPPKKDPRNLVGPTSVPTKGWFSYNIPGVRPFVFYNLHTFLRFVENPTLPLL